MNDLTEEAISSQTIQSKERVMSNIQINDEKKNDKENEVSHIANVVSGQIIYEALHNPCKFESVSYTISVHVTRKGAEKAIREQKLREYKQWRELWKLDRLTELYKQYKNMNLVYSDEIEQLIENVKDCPFGWDMTWGIREIIVQE